MGTAAGIEYSIHRDLAEAIFTTKEGGKTTSFAIIIPIAK